MIRKNRDTFISWLFLKREIGYFCVEKLIIVEKSIILLKSDIKQKWCEEMGSSNCKIDIFLWSSLLHLLLN